MRLLRGGLNGLEPCLAEGPVAVPPPSSPLLSPSEAAQASFSPLFYGQTLMKHGPTRVAGDGFRGGDGGCSESGDAGFLGVAEEGERLKRRWRGAPETDCPVFFLRKRISKQHLGLPSSNHYYSHASIENPGTRRGVELMVLHMVSRRWVGGGVQDGTVGWWPESSPGMAHQRHTCACRLTCYIHTYIHTHVHIWFAACAKPNS